LVFAPLLGRVGDRGVFPARRHLAAMKLCVVKCVAIAIFIATNDNLTHEDL
jgi:hypothetical protein